MARLFSPGPFEYDIKGRQFLVRYKVEWFWPGFGELYWHDVITTASCPMRPMETEFFEMRNVSKSNAKFLSGGT